MSGKPVVEAKRREADDIKSLRHGIAALQLANRKHAISSGDLAAVSGISRAAGYRILQTLHDEGYLTRTGSGNRVRYAPAQRVRELAGGYEDDAIVLDAAIPLMLEWTRQHGWPLAISTPSGDRSVCRFATDAAAARVLIRYRPGAQMSAPMSASAMVCLAFQPTDIQAAAIRTLPTVPVPDYAIAMSAAELTAQLKAVRSEGYSAFHPVGLREASISVPVLRGDTFCAAIAMRYMLVAEGGKAGHSQRLRMLRDLAEQISTEAASR